MQQRMNRMLTLAIAGAFVDIFVSATSSKVTVDANGAAHDSADEKAKQHADYPQLPLRLAAEYKFGQHINLSYPGLQLGMLHSELNPTSFVY